MTSPRTAPVTRIRRVACGERGDRIEETRCYSYNKINGTGGGSIPLGFRGRNRMGCPALDAADFEEGGQDECLNGNEAGNQETRMPSNTVAIVHAFVLPGAQRCWLFTKKANANPTNG